MFKLCFVVAVVGLFGASIEAQSISTPFPQSLNPFIAAHLKRSGFYNRNTYDDLYQNNYFRRVFRAPVRYGGVLDNQARIITQQHDARQNGVYQYVYETENGIRAQERGIPKQQRFSQPTGNVEGSYVYTSPEGLQVLVEYTADEDGFHPQISYDGVGAKLFRANPAPASTIITQRN